MRQPDDAHDERRPRALARTLARGGCWLAAVAAGAELADEVAARRGAYLRDLRLLLALEVHGEPPRIWFGFGFGFGLGLGFGVGLVNPNHGEPRGAPVTGRRPSSELSTRATRAEEGSSSRSALRSARPD